MAKVMGVEQREQFLAQVHIGVFAVANGQRGPLAVPVWYLYEPGGEIIIWTGADSRKAKRLEKTGRFTFCVQDENPPYRYVTVEGPVIDIRPADVETLVRPLAVRYLGEGAADAYLESVGGAAGVADDIAIRMRPERWYSLDFSEL